ncbi:SPOR domain-containing protein [Ferrimonas balearica]|nr:SPOR domain-containing protein [Ferrimonas balearica]
MKLLHKTYLPFACLALGLLLDPVAGSAQSLRRDDGPAEYPPASFRGSQYVDSEGCIYIRAGVDGSTTWVPRVSRDRKVVCGYQPTQVAGTSTAAPGGATADAAPVTITAARPENTAPEPAPAASAQARAETAKTSAASAARAPAAQQARAATQSAQVPRTTRPASSGGVRYAARPVTERRPVLPAAITPAPRPQVVRPAPTSGTTACPNLSAVGQKYVRPGPYEISCGPSGYTPPQMQTTSYRRPSGAVVVTPPAQVVKPGQVPSDTRVVPKHVYANRYVAQGANAPQVPEGYQRVFDDGRLNPHRAEQTFDGKARMELIWTNTVPRRLVEVRTGRDVTAQFPHLRPGQTGRVTGPVISTQTRAPAAAPARPAQAQRAAAYRYVQVGSFAEAGNASSTARAFGAYGGRVVNSGRYNVVLLGPFGSEADMAHALSAARRAGFDDAFPRN